LPDKPKAIVELLALRDVTPVHDVVTEPGDQTALNEERSRRSHFHFGLVGLKSGTELRSVFDQRIRCTVTDDRHIEFCGEEQSLSGAALIVANEKGFSRKLTLR
jgi:hypothetical protein